MPIPDTFETVTTTALDRKLIKKMVMKLAGLENNIVKAIVGTNVAMTEVVKSYQGKPNQSGEDIHIDVYKILMHFSIDTSKVHQAKFVGERVANFALGSALQIYPSDAVGGLTDAADIVEGFRPGTYTRNRDALREAAFRAYKKEDRFEAASYYSEILRRMVLVCVSHKQHTGHAIILINANADSKQTHDSWFQKVCSFERLSMRTFDYDVAGGRLTREDIIPAWLASDGQDIQSLWGNNKYQV